MKQSTVVYYWSEHVILRDLKINVTVASSDIGLCWVGLGEKTREVQELTEWVRRYLPEYNVFCERTVNEAALSQIKEYFQGCRQEFNLKLHQVGTEFQKMVWDELVKIPYGSTLTYGELAVRVGSPKGARAVGLANHQNPISVVVPCHRVIGKNGKLTGYAGGLHLKERLLALEGAL